MKPAHIFMTLGGSSILAGAVLATLGMLISSTQLTPNTSTAITTGGPQPAAAAFNKAQFNWRDNTAMQARFITQDSTANAATPQPTILSNGEKIQLTLHAIAKKNNALQALISVGEELQWLQPGDPIASDYQLLTIYTTHIETDVPGAEAIGLFGYKPAEPEPTP